MLHLINFVVKVGNLDEHSESNVEESDTALVTSGIVNDSTSLKSSLEPRVTKPSPTHISAAVPSNISSPTSTTITLMSTSKVSLAGTSTQSRENVENLSGENKRFAKLESLINESPSFEIEELRKLAWSGISSKARAKAWKILCGYLPPPGTASIR